MTLCAICVSRDGKWVVCGTFRGASVWDEEMHETVIKVEGRNVVWAADFSSDSARFATGTRSPDSSASIWSTTTGKRLVGPLQHHNDISGVQFSPNGERIATACYLGSIRVFDSRNGDELINMRTTTPKGRGITPLAWSNDAGQHIFATTDDNKIRSFDASTGSRLAESQILSDRYHIYSLALPADGKFIATFMNRSISFLDTSTLMRIGPVIEDNEEIRSIAISADSSYLATGQKNGKIIIRHVKLVLPGLYNPLHVSIAFRVPACWISPILSSTLTSVTVYLQQEELEATSHDSIGRSAVGYSH